jgi:starvation-inducible DNA-binding protein
VAAREVAPVRAPTLHWRTLERATHRWFAFERCSVVSPFRRFASLSQGAAMAKKNPAVQIDIGISDKDRKKIADGLSRLLADTYTLYLKTHNFHWNVTGPMFNTLHLMFEGQYNELALAVDAIAERIRALGVPAPGSYKEFAKLSSIPEADGVPSAEDMIKQLVEGQEAVVRTARAVFPATDSANDQPSADLLTQRMQTHEKTAWMLRALLA